MEAERADFPIGMMARLLGVSRSGFHDWLKRGGGDPWAAARGAVKACWEESRGRFGARSVRARLAAQGTRLTLYRVRKAMRELGMRGAAPNARKVTTVPDPGAPSRPDLVRRRFRPPVPTTVPAGDIAYLRTGQGWLYLATVIDLATRMVVGWSMSERMTAGLAVSALEMARARGYVAGGAISRSDRGSQYTSRLMAEWAASHDVRLSAGRTGSCHDNAVAESFFAALKNEMYSLRSWATRAEARHACVEFIEGYCNRRRPHSTIGYETPAERMGAFMSRMEAALSEGGGEAPLAAWDRPLPCPRY
ncbi:IS3 family transposase [Collinsella tanakaei]|nr:IS3 family transposase [Collinsella tanakaei]